jgi:hypothetical protein
MVTIKPRTLAIVCAVCLCAGWYFSAPPSRPAPLADRPFLKALARLAKTALWVMLAAEQPPEDPPHFVHAPARPDDERTLRHGEGW